MLQEFRYGYVLCIEVNDRYLFVVDGGKLTVRDLISNEPIVLLSNAREDEVPITLFLLDDFY